MPTEAADMNPTELRRLSVWLRPRLANAVPTILLIGVAGWLWWNWFGQDHVSQIRFDPVAWRRADPIDNYRTVRSQMIDDLLHRHNFRGWTRKEVADLLGPPEPGEGKKCGFPQFEVIYVLGLERGGPFSLDDEALGFVFDVEDKVSRFGVSVN
jgi:hypothetical protein